MACDLDEVSFAAVEWVVLTEFATSIICNNYFGLAADL